MRIFLVFLVFISTISFGQDCKVVDRFTSFHGIRFGFPFPDSLRKYCTIDYNQYRADSSFSIETDLVKSNSKFSNWAYFGLFFSDISFSAINDGRIYSVGLLEPIEDNDTLSVTLDKNTFFWEKVTNELTLVFGKMTKEEMKEKQFSYDLVRTWECDKMVITFTMDFTFLKVYYLSIVDKELDRQRMFLKYSK